MAEYRVKDSPASVLEYRVAKSLDKYGLPYMFQYQILGGRQRRGGFVLDFLVLTPPLSTPLLVHGEYWHLDNRQVMDDKLLEAELRTMGEFGPLVVLWGNQLQTQEASDTAVRVAFGI